MNKAVYFNHGKESGPWGGKINALAEVARQRDFAVESLDYTSMTDPAQRVKRLLDSDARHASFLILTGSSMGGWVAAEASASLRPRGLFLLAPAFYIPEFPTPEPAPIAERIEIVHGWHDPVIPFTHSLRYAEKFNASLHLLDSDHRLSNQLVTIAKIFSNFLEALEQAKG